MTGASIRAARGTELLTACGWPQEAALRMLQNNLDPEVAEHPEELVVYGGTGKAARDWASFDAIVRTLTTLKDDETLLVQSGKPVGVMQTHEWAPRVLHRQLEPRRRLGELGRVPPPRGARADDVRPDDRRVVDLHRHPGHPAGHLRDLRRGRRQALRRHARRHDHADRRARRHGRRAAARRHDERRRRDLRRGRPLAHRAPHRARLPRRRGRRPRRRARAGRRGARRRARRCRSACSATPPRSFPSCSRRAPPIDIVTDQTSAHDPLAYLPRRRRLRGLGRARATRARRFTERARESMARHVEAMVGFQDAGAEVFDYGNSHPRRGAARRLRPRVRVPRASCPPTSGRCSARARARSAGRRSPATRPTSPRPTAPCSSCSPRTSRLRAGSRMAAESGRTSRACPRASAGSATASATAPGCGSTSMVASGELAAPIVIGRDHLDSGSVASPVPRDRGDARRLRRDRRLAAAQRDGQHRARARPGCRSTTAAASASAARIHAGQVTVADGTALAGEKLERVLTNDPGMGVIRHVDAGYDRADRGRRRARRARSRWRRVSDARSSRRVRRGSAASVPVRADVADRASTATRDRRASTPRRRRARATRAPARGHAARPRQRPLARLPAGAARAHAARRRQLLDLARGHVRRWRPGSTPTDYYALARAPTRRWRWPGSPAWASSTTCTTARRQPYADRTHGQALIAAAGEAGIRITLLDACYLAGGFGDAAERHPARFSDGDARGWARARRRASQGAHRSARRSTRSGRCPPDQMRDRRRVGPSGRAAALPRLRAARGERGVPGGPRRARRPQLLAEHGALGPHSTRRPRHPPHRRRHRAARGDDRRSACARRPSATSPTASADGRPRGSRSAGRQPRGHRPLRGGARGRARPAADDRDAAATSRAAAAAARRHHHARLGWHDAGRIEPGALADLVTVGLDSVRGWRPPSRDTLLESIVFAATAADVTHTFIGGRRADPKPT